MASLIKSANVWRFSYEPYFETYKNLLEQAFILLHPYDNDLINLLYYVYHNSIHHIIYPQSALKRIDIAKRMLTNYEGTLPSYFPTTGLIKAKVAELYNNLAMQTNMNGGGNKAKGPSINHVDRFLGISNGLTPPPSKA